MKRLHAATAWLCCAMTALVAAVVLFAYGTTSFYLKGYTGEFPLSNPLLLLMAAPAFALLLVLVWRLRRGIAALGWRLPLALSALLFAAQVFITYLLLRMGRAVCTGRRTGVRLWHAGSDFR